VCQCPLNLAAAPRGLLDAHEMDAPICLSKPFDIERLLAEIQRLFLWHAPSGSMHLLSRNLKDLSHAFPELVEAGCDLPLAPSSTARS
jgi:hypothetical protein